MKDPAKQHKLDVLLAKVVIEEQNMPTRIKTKPNFVLPVRQTPQPKDPAKDPEDFSNLFSQIQEVEDLNFQEQAFRT